jgi:hypothetical protein
MLESEAQEFCGMRASYHSLDTEETREIGHTIFCTADSTEISNCLTRNGHELSYPVLLVANIIGQVSHSTVAIIKYTVYRKGHVKGTVTEINSV